MKVRLIPLLWARSGALERVAERKLEGARPAGAKESPAVSRDGCSRSDQGRCGAPESFCWRSPDVVTLNRFNVQHWPLCVRLLPIERSFKTAVKTS